jgi:drug/metabolite transporter (DMT)-like permease
VVIALATASRSATTTGVVLCMVSAVTLASGAVTQKVVLRRLSGLQAITSCYVIAGSASPATPIPIQRTSV